MTTFNEAYICGIDTIKFDDGSISVFVDSIIVDSSGNQIAFIGRDRRAFTKGQDTLADISDYISGFSGLSAPKLNDIVTILWE